MIYIAYIFRVYFIITFILSFLSLSMVGEIFYSIVKKKEYKRPWICYIPGLNFYPFFIVAHREFKLFGLIKIKKRKNAVLYYFISNASLAFLCILGRILLFTKNSPLCLYANIHFISLILFIVQFIYFRIRAYYDFFIVCQMADTALYLAVLSVFFPPVFLITVYELKKNGRLVLLEEPSPANKIS